MLRPVHVGLVVDKVALGQIFSEFFGFPVNIIPPWLFTLIYHLEDEQQACIKRLQFKDTVSPHCHEQQQQPQQHIFPFHVIQSRKKQQRGLIRML
jgi:hypothetical protein